MEMMLEEERRLAAIPRNEKKKKKRENDRAVAKAGQKVGSTGTAEEQPPAPLAQPETKQEGSDRQPREPPHEHQNQ